MYRYKYMCIYICVCIYICIYVYERQPQHQVTAILADAEGLRGIEELLIHATPRPDLARHRHRHAPARAAGIGQRPSRVGRHTRRAHHAVLVGAEE